MQLSNSPHINTSLPFREHTASCITHCNLEITLTCGIIGFGVLIRKAGISYSIVKDPRVFLLWCKLASIFPSSLLLFLCPLFIYRPLEGIHRFMASQEEYLLINLAWKALAQKHNFLLLKESVSLLLFIQKEKDGESERER